MNERLIWELVWQRQDAIGKDIRGAGLEWSRWMVQFRSWFKGLRMVQPKAQPVSEPQCCVA